MTAGLHHGLRQPGGLGRFLQPGEVVLLENTRFLGGEETNDERLSRALAELGKQAIALQPSDLASLEDFHSLGRLATAALIDLAHVTRDDRVLDAGTGIRSLGLSCGEEPTRLHILLTHLHLDHIQGLVFFAPAFRPQTEIVIWGPASPEASLRDRIAR